MHVTPFFARISLHELYPSRKRCREMQRLRGAITIVVVIYDHNLGVLFPRSPLVRHKICHYG